MAEYGERSAVISGVGISRVGRRLGFGATTLAVEAITAAVQHAGLALSDIDGVSTYPGFVDSPPGYSPTGVTAVKEALRLRLNWFSGGPEMPAQVGAIFNAVAAVHAGFARHVLCFRALTESSSQTARQRASLVGAGRDRIAGSFEWQIPFNASSAANWTALLAARYMHEFGATREQLGQIAIVARRHAALNRDAVYRSPLTIEDYLGARMISTPLGLYDCDVPVDGAVAVIISHRDTAADLRQPPLRIEAIGSALHGRDSWDQRADLTTMAAHDASEMMWQRTDLRPTDVDVAELYDGFSFLALMWIEALGFAEHGQAAEFIGDGSAISLGGELPLNTAGGQLSAGRLHGFGLLHEACTQLWGQAGDRQAGHPQVAVVGIGGGPLGGCLLLTPW
jgi:acetyl-CoA acetyltransferase